MAQQKVGALIVIEQKVGLDDVITTGEPINSDISQRLIEAIFFKNAPLHDGAVVIDNNRIVAAKCILPVTQSNVPKSLGTRHRAAIGISEMTDAVVLVVSEETGKISIIKGGKAESNIDPQRLNAQLKEALEEYDDDKKGKGETSIEAQE